MQVQAQQLRIADVVRIPGIGEYEVRQVQQLPEGVEICVNVGPDDTCTETYKFGARKVLEVKRPGDLFGGGAPATAKAKGPKPKPAPPKGMTRAEWARSLAQIAGAPDCPADVYALEMGEIESRLLEDSLEQELHALPKQWWAEGAGEIDVDEWLGRNGDYDEIAVEVKIDDAITQFHRKDALLRLSRAELMKRALSRLFAKVLKALRNAKALGDKVAKSRAGTKARDKWLAKLGVAEGQYDQAVEDMAIALGHGEYPDDDDEDLDADVARSVYQTIRRCAEELALGKRLERQVRQRQLETMRAAPREKIAGGRAAGRRPEEFDPADLARGIEAELEHTGDRALAREIAMDHLAERPDYYDLLEKMEATPEPPDLAALQAERLAKPWTTDASRYQSALGVKQPWIAEISPVQYGRMSARAKKAYDAKRAAEWEASGVAKERWRKEVLRAFDLGQFRLDDDDVTEDAREAVRLGQRRVAEAAEKSALALARTANQVLPGELEVGDRVYDLMRGKYGTVSKVFKKSARVDYGDGASTTGIGGLQWHSYNDLLEVVKRGDPVKPARAPRRDGASLKAAEDRLRIVQEQLVAQEKAWMLRHPRKLREAKYDFPIAHRTVLELLERAETAYRIAHGTGPEGVPWLAAEQRPTVEDVQALITAGKAKPTPASPSARADALEQRQADERRARLHKAQQYPATTVKTTGDAMSVLADAFLESGWKIDRAARYTYVTDPTDSFRLQLKDRTIRAQHRPRPGKGFVDGRSWGGLIAGAREWPKLVERADRIAGMHARKLRVKLEAVPEPVPLAQAHARAEAEGKLLLRVNPEEGILLCGDTKPVKDAIKTVRPRFRYSRNLPKGCGWYVPRSRGQVHSHAEVQRVADAIATATGRGVDVDHAGTPHVASPPATARATEPAATFIPPVFRGKTGPLTEDEAEVLWQLESAILDNPWLPQDEQTRQYFESDGEPYVAAYTLVGRGMAEVVDQNLKGATHWVLIRATDEGLRYRDRQKGSTFEVGDSVVTTTLDRGKAKPTPAEVAAQAKAEYEQITESATRGAGLTPYLEKRRTASLKRWEEAEAKAKRAGRTPKASKPAPVFVTNMANYMKGLPDRASLGALRDVLRKAGRDLGVDGVKKMRAYLRKQPKYRRQGEDISAYAYQVIGELAMAKGTFPPVPERGDTYSRPEWRGYVNTITDDPSIKRVIDESEDWPAKMVSVLEKTGAVTTVGTPEGSSWIWDEYNYRSKVRKEAYTLVDSWRVSSKPKTVKLLQEHMEYARGEFQRLADEMRMLLDPKIWDYKRSKPEDVYPILCKIDPEFARRVLERLYGVSFDWGREGRDQASDLCEGKGSITEIKAKRARSELETAQSDLASAKRHKALAAKLLPVFKDASKGGTRLYTKVLLNNALRRAGYKLGKSYESGKGFTESTYTSGMVRTLATGLSLKLGDEFYHWNADIPAKGASEDQGFKALEAEVRRSAANGVGKAASTVEHKEDVLAEILGKPRAPRPEPKKEKVEPMAKNGSKPAQAEALAAAYTSFREGRRVPYRAAGDFRTGWESVGMFCQQRTQGGMSITICPSLLPKGHKDCPPIPERMFKSSKTKIVLCQPGRDPTYFAHPHRGGLEQAKIEADRRFAGAGKKASVRPGDVVPAPVEQFKAQDQMLEQLVPTRTILVEGKPRFVAVGEPVDAKGEPVSSPDVGSGPYTAMVELRSRPDGVGGVETVSTKGFVASLQARKYQIVPEVLPWDALHALAMRVKYAAPGDGYHSVRVGNERLYYVETASGEVPDPVDAGGLHVSDRKQIAAFRSKIKRTVVVEPPKGQSLRDGVMALMPGNLAHYYNPQTGHGWGSKDGGKTWGRTVDFTAEQYRANVRDSMLKMLERHDTPGQIYGAWTGLAFPTDFPKGRVTFDPPTGGTFDLAALAAELAAAKQAELASDTVTTRRASAAAQRRLNWAKKEIKAAKRRPAKAKAAAKPKPAPKPKAAARPRKAPKPKATVPKRPKIRPLSTPKIKPRDYISRSTRLWAAVIDYNLGGTRRLNLETENWRVELTPGEMGTLIRQEVREDKQTRLSWEGPGKGYRFSDRSGTLYYDVKGPDPAEVARLYNAGAPAPGREDVDLAAFKAKDDAARRAANQRMEEARRRAFARRAEPPTPSAPQPSKPYRPTHVSRINPGMEVEVTESGPDGVTYMTMKGGRGVFGRETLERFRRNWQQIGVRAKPAPAQKPVQKQGHIPVELSWREGEIMLLCKVPSPTPQVLRVVLAQLGFSPPDKRSGGCWYVRRSSDRHYSERHLAALAGRLDASGFDVTATYQGQPVAAAPPREAPPKAAIAAVAPPVPVATTVEKDRGIKPRHLQIVPAAAPSRAKPKPAKPAKPARPKRPEKPAKPAKARKPAKPKPARKPARPKAAPKGRKGRYAVLAGSPGRKGTPISTHRTKVAALKAAKTWVAKDQLEKIVKGGSRSQSSAVVYHDGTNLEAAVRLLVPTVHRRSIVKSAKHGNDSYDEITIGLVKLCNVDLGRRIAAGKAKHKAPAKSASKRPAPRKTKRKLSSREQSRLLDRYLAGKDKI